MTDNRFASKLPDTSDSVYDAAPRYALLGFRVIPIHTPENGLCSCNKGDTCHAVGKHPRVLEWQKKATNDLGQVGRWWKQWPNSNIGLAMGGEARLVALDIDGQEGRNSLAKLEAEHTQLPTTLTSRSGRVDGGEHRLFRVPDELDIQAISNKVSVAPGLDVRTEGGQIVVPPSLHASGNRYEWTHKVPPAPLPPWLYALMVPKPQPRSPYIGDFSRPKGAHPYIWAALTMGSNTVATAQPGTRNETLNSEAYCLGQLVGGGVLDRILLEEHLTKAALHAGLDEQEIRYTLKSAIDAGMKEPRGLPRKKNRHTHQVAKASDKARPQISLSGTLYRQAEQVWSAIKTHNNQPFLFKRGRSFVRIAPSMGRNVIEELTSTQLRSLLQDRFEFTKVNSETGNTVFINPPIALMNYLIGQSTWPLPELQNLIQAPVFIPPDAELADTNGYHSELDAFMDLEGFKPRRSMPLQAARQLLHEWLHDFPFADEASRTHAFTFALTLLLRPLIKGNVPLFLISAPVPGTGKSLLVQTLCSVVTGTPAATMTEASDTDEWRKRITSVLQTSPPVVLLDNINRKLNSDALASVITSPIWQDRRLGQTEMLRVQNNAVWVATANNPIMSGELARRSIWIHMDPTAERPWTRTGFLHPLPKWGEDHRAELFGALVTIVETWKNAGRPLAAPALGSFENWASILGGVLQVAGFGGFLGNLEALWGWNDSESREWRAFTQTWWLRFQSNPVGVGELQRLAEEHDLLASVLGDGGERSRRIRLGKSLGKRVDRVFGKKVIRRSNHKHRNINIYRLLQTND